MQITNKKLFWPLFALLCIFFTYRIYKYQKVNFQSALNIEKNSKRPQVNLEKIKASGIPILDIKVKYNYLARLSTTFSSGKSEKPHHEIQEDKKSYKAKVFYQGKKYKGKISFRGEGDWHRRFWKKSLKIKLKSDERLFGYRILNLDNPKYVAPFLRVVQYETAKKMGLIAPASFPVWVNLNGMPYGILQFWGRYDRDMLSESNHPEGDLYGEKDNYLSFDYLMSDKQNWKKYTSKLGKKDFKNMDNIQRLMVINNLEGVKFKKAVYEFFDIDQMLAYHNHANLFSATRQNYHNVRVYFNPISLKYELVPNDLLATTTNLVDQNIYKSFNKLWKKIFSLPEIRKRKREQLDYFINDYKIFDFIQERFAFWNKMISPIISMDQVSSYGLKNNYDSNFPNIEDQYKYQVGKWNSYISQRKEFLEKAVQKNDILIKKVDSSLNISNQGYLDERIDFIEIQSSSKLPAKLSFISSSDSKTSLLGKVTSIGSNKYRIKIDQIIPSQALYGEPDDDGPDNPKVHYSIQKGQPVVYSAKLSKNFKVFKFQIQQIKQTQAFDDFTLSPLKTKFISPVDSFEIKTRNDLENRFPRKVVPNFTIKNKLTELKQSKKIIEKQEKTTWNIKTNFIVNEDEVLVIRKGVQVLLDPDVSIQVKGTLLVDGSKELPVIFTSSNDLKPWGSLYWQNNHNISKLKHFKVINGNNHRTSLQYYSGVVSAYNSSIILENCEFKQNRGIDVLNVKYSYSLVDSCLFIDNADDAIDYDFSSGKIMNSKFISNGGDGVDLSFATTLIENNFFEKNADKGISVGEKSMPIIKNNQLKSSQIGIAVKDISVARITGNTFIDNKKDIFLYNKKPYFGGGLGILSNNKYPSGKAKIKVSSESKTEVIK